MKALNYPEKLDYDGCVLEEPFEEFKDKINEIIEFLRIPPHEWHIHPQGGPCTICGKTEAEVDATLKDQDDHDGDVNEKIHTVDIEKEDVKKDQGEECVCLDQGDFETCCGKPDSTPLERVREKIRIELLPPYDGAGFKLGIQRALTIIDKELEEYE